MYQPTHAKFVERRPAELYGLIREYPLGTLVTQSERGSDANHVPFLIHETSSVTLTAHVPRANPVWNAINTQSVLVVFNGPNAYISPSWYPSKRLHGKAVPTWNYAIVHVRGTARAIEDRAWLRDHLEEMTSVHELHSEHPWKISDAPTEYIGNLLESIVGIEIEISSIEGKFKLGQNRFEEDRQAVARELEKREPRLAKLTRERQQT